MKIYIKYTLRFLVLLSIIVFWSSCRNDFETTLSSGQLEFSRDTVYLDTVFTNIGSSTYTFKVYNRSDNAISIPYVGLAQGESSNYRLNIDGIPGKTFENVEILAKDSIFVFVETTLDFADFQAENTDFLYTDAINFDTGINEQKVELVTLVQDAIFLYPQRDDAGIKETLSLGEDGEGNEVLIEGFFLDDDELTFTADKPYVIYGYAAVPPDKTLNIEAGARVHFHSGSGIIVANRASLHVNGRLSTDQDLLENEVIFESDRLEPDFSDVPGQWGLIWLTDGSTDNKIEYATIKNSTVGVLMDSNDGTQNPTLTVRNTQIYNSSNIGLYARTGTILGENLVINNSGISSLWLALGGSYNFTHCTFANYWSQGFRNYPAVQIDNYLLTADQAFVADLTAANFTNCIIAGNQGEEFSVNYSDEAAFNFHFKNCLIQFDDNFGKYSDDPLYNFNNSVLYENIILSENPDFKDPENNDFRITEDSAANGLGDIQAAQQVPFDILGTDRTNNPDLGAYESATFED